MPVLPAARRRDVTYLHACQMLSYARLSEALDGQFGLKISEGAIAIMLGRAETPFARQAARIAEAVPQSPVIASDETSARDCAKCAVAITGARRKDAEAGLIAWPHRSTRAYPSNMPAQNLLHGRDRRLR